MPRKPKPKPDWDDPEESKRFLETAEAVEARVEPKDFDKVLKKIAPHRPAPKPSR